MKKIAIITIILLNFLGAFAQKASTPKTAAEKVLFLIVYDNDSIYITDRDVTSVTSHILGQDETSEEPIKPIDLTEWESDEL